MSASVRSQIKFTASANETEIGSSDLVQITFKIENATSVNKILPPVFRNFSIINGPSQQRNTAIRNGVRTSFISVSYILKPKRAGSFVIPPALAVVNGQEITSNSVEIRVSRQDNISQKPPHDSGSSAPHPNDDNGHILTPGEDVIKKIKENLLLKLEANKTSCYVGESVVVSFDLYTRLLSKSTITDAPSFNGFSVSEMDVSNSAEEVSFDGKEFSKYTLRKVQLFPLQSGNYTISPLQSDNSVSFFSSNDLNNQEMDPMMKMMQDLGVVDVSPDAVQENIPLTSNRLVIRVKALPEENKPQGFTGAVGSFSIQSGLTKDTITTDEIGELTVSISGEGNFNLLTSPNVEWPEYLESMDTKSSEHIDNNISPLRGRKTFSTPFSVTKTGSYEIPPIRFSWFDPQTQKYHSAQTEALKIQVLPGKKEIADTSQAEDTRSGSSGIFKWAFFTIIGLLVATGIFVTLKKKKNIPDKHDKDMVSTHDTGGKKEREVEQIHEQLRELGYQIQYYDSQEFFKHLDFLLQQYFKVKMDIESPALTHTLILQTLTKLNIPQNTMDKTREIFSGLERNLYTKSPDSKTPRQVYEESLQLVNEVEAFHFNSP